MVAGAELLQTCRRTWRWPTVEKKEQAFGLVVAWMLPDAWRRCVVDAVSSCRVLRDASPARAAKSGTNGGVERQKKQNVDTHTLRKILYTCRRRCSYALSGAQRLVACAVMERTSDEGMSRGCVKVAGKVWVLHPVAGYPRSLVLPSALSRAKFDQNFTLAATL